jgi:hypothetical protein
VLPADDAAVDHVQLRTLAQSAVIVAAGKRHRKRACQLAVFSGKLPSMEAEIDCKLQSNSR